jgi:hypothetical protein
MLLIREVFIAKPGHAGALAARMKEEAIQTPGMKVMLDSVTDYNKIVCEYEVESLTAYEKMMNEWKSKPQKKPAKKSKVKYTDLYLTGKREIFRIL